MHTGRRPQWHSIPWLTAWLVAAAFLIAGCLIIPPPPEAELPPGVPAGSVKVLVLRVLDGDTIEVSQDNRIFTVHYALVDAPEPDEPLYNEATKLHQLILGGQEVYLLADAGADEGKENPLGYIFTRDGLLVNGEMVRQGMAQLAENTTDTRFRAEIAAAQAEAQELGAGIWP